MEFLRAHLSADDLSKHLLKAHVLARFDQCDHARSYEGMAETELSELARRMGYRVEKIEPAPRLEIVVPIVVFDGEDRSGEAA